MSLRRLLAYATFFALGTALASQAPALLALVLLYCPAICFVGYIFRKSDRKLLHLSLAAFGASAAVLLTPIMLINWGRPPTWLELFMAHSVPLGLNISIGVFVCGVLPCLAGRHGNAGPTSRRLHHDVGEGSIC